MGKKFRCIIVSCIACILLLTGCSSHSPESEDNIVEKPSFVLDGSLFNNNKIYELQDGMLQEVKTNVFSAPLIVGGEEYDIRFWWGIANGELRIENGNLKASTNGIDNFLPYEDFPFIINIDQIEDSTSQVILRKLHENDRGAWDYYLCDLNENSITPIFEDVFNDYSGMLDFISPEFKTCLFSTSEYLYTRNYFDGEKVIDLGTLFDDYYPADGDHDVEAMFADGFIYVFLRDFTDKNAQVQKVYRVDPSDMSYEEVYSGDRWFRNNFQHDYTFVPHGIPYTYCLSEDYTEGCIEIINLRDGSILQTNIEGAPNIAYYDRYLIVFYSSGDVTFISCETGEVVSTVKTELGYYQNFDYKIVKDGDNCYLLIPTESDGILAYKLYI